MSQKNNHKKLFEFLRTHLPNDEVVIQHPLVTTTLTKGIVTCLALGDVLAGRYITDNATGIDYQLTLYHHNFASINDLNDKVLSLCGYTGIQNFEHKGWIKIIRNLSPKFIASISLWQSVIIIRWFCDREN